MNYTGYGMHEKLNPKIGNHLYLFLYVFQKMLGVIITWNTAKHPKYLLYPIMPQSIVKALPLVFSSSHSALSLPLQKLSMKILGLLLLFFYAFLLFVFSKFIFSWYSSLLIFPSPRPHPQIYSFHTRIDFAFLNVSNLIFWTLPIDTYTMSWPTLRANLMRSPKAKEG